MFKLRSKHLNISSKQKYIQIILHKTEYFFYERFSLVHNKRTISYIFRKLHHKLGNNARNLIANRSNEF